MSHRALLAAAGAQGKTYVEDVFSAWTYQGNGATQTITNGIDLTKGGLVWAKWRSGSYSNASNSLFDTIRGSLKALYSDSTIAENSQAGSVTAFNSNGFSVGADASGYVNGSGGQNYASWTFRRSPRFFDVVTWTGDGTSNRQIPHALGIAPGMVTAKRRDSTGDWAVWHRSATGDLYLEQTAAQTGSFTQITAASATTFSVSSNANINGATYVAYAWAHDPDTVNGIVQCGSVTTDGSGNATVSLGWEPQYVVTKTASGTAGWAILDSSRGLAVAPATSNPFLQPNASSAEAAYGATFGPSATGFSGAFGAAGSTFIYLAIRRGPMRTPTSGASVYNAIARTGTGAAATVTGVGFAPDMLISKSRNQVVNSYAFDRLRGASAAIRLSGLTAEQAVTDLVVSYDPNGVSFGTDATLGAGNFSAYTYANWLFARAPGFFDIVCYKGTGANQTLAHNLGVAPKMMWIKDRTTANDWAVYHSALGAGQALILDSSAAAVANTVYLNNTAPTATGFSVGVDAKTNTSGDNYAAYLFGEVAGVSKIGSYVGTGAAQTISCGFTNGARFLLIKLASAAAGDWAVFDTVRGIVSGNDPFLALDTTAAEVTTIDVLTPQSVGFGLTGANYNATGATYIYLAIA